VRTGHIHGAVGFSRQTELQDQVGGDILGKVRSRGWDGRVFSGKLQSFKNND
jgi:hypothetical protein